MGCRSGSTDPKMTRHGTCCGWWNGLRASVPVPVVLQDERLSSREAESRLAVNERDWRKRKSRLDAAAAAVILQDYLDHPPARRSTLTRCLRGLMRRLIVVILAVLVTIAAAAGVIYSRVDRPFKGYGATEQFVEVPPGSGPAAIGRRLVQAGVVRDALTWRIAVFKSGHARLLKAGEYRFEGELRPADVIGKLARGEVYLRPITFPEGLSITGDGKAVRVEGLWHGGVVRDRGAERGTHRRARSARVRSRGLSVSGDVPAAAPNECGRARAGDGLAVRANRRTGSARQGCGPRARRARYRDARLAGGEGNRPTRGAAGCRPRFISIGSRSAWGCSATPRSSTRCRRRAGIPATSRAPIWVRLSVQHLQARRTAPGPIAAPGRPSIEAVLNPADVAYLYFVSRNDGSHVFSDTSEEHRAKVKAFQVDYFRAK